MGTRSVLIFEGVDAKLVIVCVLLLSIANEHDIMSFKEGGSTLDLVPAL